MASGKQCSLLYLMQTNISKNIVNAVENANTVELQHKRLSHMSEKRMNVLTKKKKLFRLDGAHLKKCTHCLAGKQN